MELRPDNLKMVVGEVRSLALKLSGVTGGNVISSLSFEACPALITFGAPNFSGSDGDVVMTAANSGTCNVVATAVLGNGEKVVGKVQVKISDPCCGSGDRY